MNENARKGKFEKNGTYGDIANDEVILNINEGQGQKRCQVHRQC